MRIFTIEVSIPDELQAQFEDRIQAFGGDTGRYIKEVVARDLVPMRDPARQRMIDAAFEAIDQKYGKALKKLAG